MFPLIEISWWGWLLLALVSVQFTIVVCVSIYLHRDQSHRALTVHPALAHLIRAWLWISTGQSTSEWVDVHSKHHTFCETEKDPHSPQIHGLGKVMLLGVWMYTKAAREPQALQRYAKGTPNDWLERHVYQPWSLWGPLLLLPAYLALFGIAKGTALYLVQILWTPFWAAGVINGVAHTFGYRNFATGDASRNMVRWGLWIAGEELHNNHHAHPTSAKFSYRPGEIDIGWGVVRVLEWLRLARVHRTAQAPVLLDQPQDCAPELLARVARHRLQVGNWFDALWSGSLDELRRCHQLTPEQAGLLKDAYRSLVLSGDAQVLLERQQELHALRAHWQALQRLWEDRKAGAQDLARDFALWCERAESAGIGALREYSLRLRRLGT